MQTPENLSHSEKPAVKRKVKKLKKKSSNKTPLPPPLTQPSSSSSTPTVSSNDQIQTKPAKKTKSSVKVVVRRTKRTAVRKEGGLSVEVPSSSSHSSRRHLSERDAVRASDELSRTSDSRRRERERYSPQSPRRVTSLSQSAMMSLATDLTYQGILHNALIGMMSVLLQYTASRTMYNKSESLLSAMDVQAENIVEEELRKLVSSNHVTSDRPQSPNLMTAYAQLANKLTSEIKASIIQHPDRERLHALSDSLTSLRQEHHQTRAEAADVIARKEQELEGVRSEQRVLEAKNLSLLTAVDLLEKELQVSRMAVNDLQQQKVLLKLKCFQYKGDVDRIASVLHKAVKNKIGFLPRNIDEQLSRLVSLPPPVDDKIPDNSDVPPVPNISVTSTGIAPDHNNITTPTTTTTN